MSDAPTGDSEPSAPENAGELGKVLGDPAKIELPAPSLAPTALPSTLARGLAFAAIIVAGLCGGLVGWAVTDLQCSGDCGTPSTLGAVAGAIFAAGGVAIIAVLTLRAMSEWNAQAPIRQRRP